MHCNQAYEDMDLKADVFQTPHHGWNINSDFFNAVAPQILLLPAHLDADCQNVIKQKVMANMLEGTTQWVGSYHTWKLTMPFEGDTPCEMTWKELVEG